MAVCVLFTYVYTIYYAFIDCGSYQSYSWAAALLVAVRHILQLVTQHHLTCQAAVPRYFSH